MKKIINILYNIIEPNNKDIKYIYINKVLR